MNKILVLAKNQNTYFIKRLFEEVDSSSLEIFNPFQLQNPIKFLEPDLILTRTTGVYHSDQDLKYLEGQKGQIINPLFTLKTFRAKSIQYEFLKNKNFKILPWKRCDISLTGFEDFDSLLVKPDRGQGGRGIKYFNREDYQLWYQQQVEMNDLDYVLQPYVVPNRELRVFFIHQKLWVLERWSDDGPVNFFQGGYAKPSKLEKRIEDEVRRLIDSSGALYGAIDLLVDKHSDHYFLELNSVPGIEQLEEIFKDNILKVLISGVFKA